MALGVCYYPEHWPESWWPEDARRMRELGIEYVRIGEFAWSRLERKRNLYDWGWLDRAFETLGAAGLKIVLGTPTATPPKWLMDEYPEIAPIDEHGARRGFGSRRHYRFSSEVYLRECGRIVEAIAKRYGRHNALAGWQTDNEYGCHDTILSFDTETRSAFQEWLRRRYQTPQQLNEAWGAAFWSMEVDDFRDVELPNLTVTEANPAAQLDFRRYASEQVKAFDRLQVDIIRAHSPGRWITHNFMGFIDSFDHWSLAENLDFASWDSYPIGFVERFPFNEAEKLSYCETSHPDIAPFHHDLYRGVGGGKFWVMEQQPGPVNWAPYNPSPAAGMVKLWTMEAHAHGAEVVSYFRWRQAHFAQEQMHAGLNLPNSHELSRGGYEAAEAAAALSVLGPLPPVARASVALVFDYEGNWTIDIQRQGADYAPLEAIFRWYEAIRRLGQDVDIVRPGTSLVGYRLVLVPILPIISDAAERAFSETDAVVLFGARTGSKTRNYSIPENLPPGLLAAQLKLRVIEVSSLRPGLVCPVCGAITGSAERWTEIVETQGEVLARFANGKPALAGTERRLYAAFWPDEAALKSLMRLVAERACLKIQELPADIRVRRRGALSFYFNYGRVDWRLPDDGELLLGSRDLPPAEFAVLRRAED